MNLLYDGVTDSYGDLYVHDILEKLVLEQCVVVFSKQINQKESYVAQQFATEMVYMEDADFAKYEYLSFYEKCPPIDVAIAKAMAPYLNQIYAQMRRYCKFVSYDELWWQCCEHIRVWNYVLDHYGIDLFISTVSPHQVYNYVIYGLCKIKNIPCFFTEMLQLEGYSCIIDDIYDVIPSFPKEYSKVKSEYRNKDVSEIKLTEDMDKFYRFYTNISSDLTPYYMKGRYMNGPEAWGPISKIVQKISSKFFYEKYSFFAEALPIRIKFILSEILAIGSFSAYKQNKIQTYFNQSYAFREMHMILDYYKKHVKEVDYNKKYVYVPLHLQPERTSTPQGGEFYDQVLMIKMLSYFLPQEYMIYVKENPKQERYVYGPTCRSIEFYRQINSLSNVQFVSLNEDTYKLIDNSQAVATLTGTAGFEAICRNKLFLMFGYHPMQYAPNVYAVRSNEDCQKAIKAIGEGRRASAKDIKLYFKALEKYAFWGQCSYGEECMTPEEMNIGRKNIIYEFTRKIYNIFGTQVFKNRLDVFYEEEMR